MEKVKKKPSVGRIIGRVLLGVLVLLLLLLLLMWLVPFTESAGNVTVSGSESWMAGLSDELKLNEITIPGTHDSGTQYAQLAFFSKCQSKSIADQLSDGFRYLDIRLAVKEDSAGNPVLGFMHGFVSCKQSGAPWSKQLMLDSVLADCYAFLDANPSECIIFAVKQETGSESVSEFQALLDSYISQSPEYWYLDDSIPTLGEVRGKLILLRRYEDEGGLLDKSGAALIWPNQNGYEDSSLAFSSEGCRAGDMILQVQDRYEYTAEEKWAAFCADSTAAADTVTINFLSTKGHATFGHPYYYSKTLNPMLLDLYTYGSAPNGWTVIDFGNAELAAAIYNSNF